MHSSLPDKLRSLSFTTHRRLARRRSPPHPMTKKKKHKDKTASGSSSGSTSSVSSETETAKNGVAISVDPDFPSSEGAPPASSKPEDALTDLNGAVTATTADRVNEIPNSEIEGAVTATIEEGEIVTLSEQNGAVSATNTDRESEIPNPEIEGAVTATTGETVIMTLPEENGVVTITNVDRPDELSQPKSVGAVTATVEEGEFVPPPSPTPATKQCVPVENDGIVNTQQAASPHGEPAPISDQAKLAANHWRKFVKPSSKKLEPEGKPFLLDSGESCVKRYPML